MHRIDAAGYAPGNLFTDGNPATGTPATVVDAAWLNDLQENVIQIAEAAGIALVKGDYTQLLTALRSAGVFQTRPQFDNTTQVATTGFVKDSGIAASGITTVTTTSALALSTVGGTVLFNAAAAIVPTLPAASTVPVGRRIEMMNINAGVATVTRAGTDTINVNGSTVTIIALGAGDTLTLESNGATGWYAVGGSAQLGSAGMFGVSKSASGYQKLPSGLIIQWGTFTTTPGSVSFPIAFPTGCVGVVATAMDSQNTTVYTTSISNTSFSWNVNIWSGTSIGSYCWIAIGY